MSFVGTYWLGWGLHPRWFDTCVEVRVLLLHLVGLRFIEVGRVDVGVL